MSTSHSDAGPASIDGAAPTVSEQLVAGSVALIDAEGLGDLSVRRLATAAGRTTMCVYTKFGSRAGLLGATYDALAAELLGRLEASADRSEELAAYASASPGRYAFLIGTDPTMLGLDAAPRQAFLDALVGVLGHGDPVVGRAAFAGVHADVVLGLGPQTRA